MSWNYRHAGNWRTSTVKQRKNGQWVSISSDDGRGGGDNGKVPSRFYTEGPPERNGDTIIYDGSSYSSLQAAHDALSPGDTLYIDPSNSPYQERLLISQSNITIKSDGNITVDSNGTISDDGNGAWIEQPNNNENYAIAMDVGVANVANLRSPDTSLIGSYTGGGEVSDGTPELGEGEMTISVSDVSSFSAGDDIYVMEERRPYGDPVSGGSSGADETHEFHTVADVDTSANELTLTEPLFLPFPNNNTTEVGVMDWPVKDIHITGLNIRGLSDCTGSGNCSRPFKVYGTKYGWFDNLHVDEGGSYTIGTGMTHRCRFDQIQLGPSYDYGMTVASGSTSTYITDIVGEEINHYVVRGGPSGDVSTVDCRVENIGGRNYKSGSGPTANVHQGGYFFAYYDMTAEGVRSFRPRSRALSLDGFQDIQGVGRTFETRQRPFHIYIGNGEVINKQSGHVFSFDLRNDTHNEAGGDITFENITIDAYDGNDITDIGYFDDACIIDGLTFRNITYDGIDLTRSHVESWQNYGSADITDLTVE